MRALDRALAMLALGRDGKFLSFQNDELDALSSLAAEIGRLEQRAKKAEVLLLLGWDLESAINEHPHDNIGRHATEIAQRYADNPNVKASPTLLRAALSSPAPEGMAGGDEVVP